MEVVITSPAELIPAASHRIEDLIEAFLYARDRNDSSRSLYKRILRRYFQWVEEMGLSLKEITLRHLFEFKAQHLGAGKSSLTVASYINAIRGFYEWAEGHKLYPNVAKGLDLPKRENLFLREALTPDQTVQLLDAVKRRGDLREYALINLAVHTGLRTIEISRANIEDITYISGVRVLLVLGKGRDTKDNFVKLTTSPDKAIADYLATRPGAKGSEPLFSSESNNSAGQRITTRTIRQIVKKALQDIGLDDRCYTAHSLRHTVGNTIYEFTGDLEKVRNTLRHRSTAPSLTYVKTAERRRRLLENSGEDVLENLFKH